MTARSGVSLMTQSPTKSTDYAAAFKAFRQSRGADGLAWLNNLGDQAWSSFSQLGFPTARRGNEKWKYTNVGPIAKAGFGHSWDLKPDDGSAAGNLQALAPLQQEWANLVFVDGRFSSSLSAIPELANGARVTSLAEAVKYDRQVVQQHMADYASFEEDGFTALNTAFLSDGAFVHVPEGSVSSAPVHLVFITTERALPRVSYPRTLIVADKNAELTVIETHVGPPDSQYFTNAVTEIAVGDGAKVDHYRLLLEGPQAFHVGTSRVRQGQDSGFSSASFSMGATLARNDFQVLLDGAGASCVLNGLYLTSNLQHIDNLINIDHAKPHTTSRLAYRGILDGKSKAVFGGQVLVRKDAQKVEAQQSDKNLLLSDQAEVDSKPSLLIYADDVKCGHGATAGHVDADSLFYLRSRGLTPETASQMLVHAFAREIIETVNLEPLREYLDGLFLRAVAAKDIRIGSGS